ncbi:uncharacterized protein [Branchiostoma lanceolatum]|uniref:uncharacterized protein n=1 Tax=Branchiostoma lanceolatum TaxID=7740 RepID=UPI0034552644
MATTAAVTTAIVALCLLCSCNTIAAGGRSRRPRRSSMAECPQGYQIHEGICYKAFDWPEKFLNASRICSTTGGTLAMPKDNSTNTFLISLTNTVNSTTFFFGLVDYHQEGAWEWIDGTPIGNYNAWGQGGTNDTRDGDCAGYFSNAWHAGQCSKERGFICEIIPAGCPDEYVYHEPSRVCYRAFDKKKKYNDSVDACSSDGGTLAMPRDNVTNKFLIYLKNAVNNGEWFRFGLTYIQQEGIWTWADNVTLGNFDAWPRARGPNKQYKTGNSKGCAEYFKGNVNDTKKNKWNDGPCSGERRFICQVIPTVLFQTSTINSITGNYCY